MRLSALQKYILRKTYRQRQKTVKSSQMLEFYTQLKKKPARNLQVKIISKSIMRLIDRELLIGWGERTPHKLYIQEIKLTPKGRRIAKQLWGTQQKLPFSRKKNQSIKPKIRSPYTKTQ